MTQASQPVSLGYEPTPRQALFHASPARRRLYGGSAGGGKVSPVDALVCTPKGWVRIGDIAVGDSITDPTTGGGTKVIGVFPQGEVDFYEAVFDDGARAEFGLEHLWIYRSDAHTKRRPRRKASSQRQFAVEHLAASRPDDRWDNWLVGTTAQVMQLQQEHGVRIPLTEPVLFTVNGRTGASLDPYLLGLMLGDGHLPGFDLTTADPEIAAYVLQHSDPMSYGATGEIRKLLRVWLANHGLSACRSWEKFIPPYVQTASVEYRLAFLQGLMDTDGYVDDRGRCYYSTTSLLLAAGVQDLVRGLGGKARTREKSPTYTYKGEKLDGRPAYDIRVWLRRTSSLFRLPRKKTRCTDKWGGGHELTRELISITPSRKAEGVCIKVSSPYGLYVTNDCVVTHNTAALMYECVQQCLETPGWPVLFLRRTYGELDQLITRFRERIPSSLYTYTDQKKIVTFRNKSTIRFAHCEQEADATRFRSDEYGCIAFDELTTFTYYQYEFITSRLRTTIPGAFENVIAGTNPGGIGHVWVKNLWITKRPAPGQDPMSYRPEDHDFIPAKVSDNPYIKPEYVETLNSLNPDLRAALRDGSWDVLEGQYFDVIPPPIPPVVPTTETAWVSIDWGYTDPTAILWHFLSPDMTITTYRERTINRATPQEVGRLISSYSTEPLDTIILSHEAFGKRTSERTLADEMAATLPLYPVPADTDRVNGWALLYNLLATNRWRITSDCTNLIEAIPAAIRRPPPRQQDIADFPLDHYLDAARYGLKTTTTPSRPPAPDPTERAKDPTSLAMMARIAASRSSSAPAYAVLGRRHA